VKLPLRIGLISAVVVFVVDQASKYWILNVFRLPERGSVAIFPGLNFTMVWNHAVTFGMFGGVGAAGRVLFSVMALAIVSVLVLWMLRTEKPIVGLAAGAIAGGAIGNVIDRLRYGAVVDFIHAHAFGWSWYVFNIADSAIVCSVILLMLCEFWTSGAFGSKSVDNKSGPDGTSA
jgi:signal peptidase II